MAMITCKECKSEVSSKATVCPKCGAPIRWKQNFGCGSSLLIIGGAMALIITLVNGVSRTIPATPPTASSAAVRTEREFVATAEQSFAEAMRAVAAKNYTAAVAAGMAIMQRYPNSQEAAAVKPVLKDWMAFAAKEKEAAHAERKRQQAAAQKAQEQRRAGALKGLSKNRDDVAGISFYGAPGGNLRSPGNRFGLYLAVPDSGRPYVRFKWMYSGDDWLFVEKVRIKIDDRDAVDIPYSHFEVNRDHDSGVIWEWMDSDAAPEIFPFFESIGKAKKVTVRMEGDKYYKDRQLSAGERAAILRILQAYRDLQ